MRSTKSHTALLLLGVFSLGGCAAPGSPRDISRFDEAQIQSVSVEDLEKTCLLLKSRNVMQELERRGLMTNEDLQAASQGQIRLGGSEAELMCALPMTFFTLGHKATSTSPEGVSTSYTMTPWPLHKRVSAVVKNGKITAYTIY